MSITNLYDALEDNLSFDDINGELMLTDETIIWVYSLDKHFNDDDSTSDFQDDESDEQFNFSSESNEEILQNKHKEDFEKIELVLDELEEEVSWTFSDPEIVDDIISFKIF